MNREAPTAARAQAWGGRIYFAVQAVAGLAWWVGVFLSPAIRTATLGSLDPVAVAAFDIPLFVIASGVAAFGVRAAAVVAAGWTGLVAVALAIYATITSEAGWGGVPIMLAAAACSVVALFFVVQGRVPTELIVRGGPFAFRPASNRRSTAANVGGATMGGQLILFWGVSSWWFFRQPFGGSSSGGTFPCRFPPPHRPPVSWCWCSPVPSGSLPR